MLYKIDQSGEVVSEKKEMDKTINKNIAKAESAKEKQLKSVNMFARQVIERMKKDNVLPSPKNYLNYFEKMLLEKSPSQKESIEEILRLESDSEIEKEYISKVDVYLNDSFEKTKQLLDDINISYVKINKIKKFIKTKGVELTKNLTPANIDAFESKIDSAVKALNEEQEKIKSEYIDLAKVIKEFNKESIIDKKYSVYNKKYLFEAIQNELNNMKNFEYKNSVIAFCISHSVLKDVKLKNDKDVIIKTVAKMILDRSRRSDVLAHYEDGIFLLILKHTDLDSAKKALESIKNFVAFSNFIIDSKPIQAKIDASIIEMKSNMNVDEVITDAIKGLVK